MTLSRQSSPETIISSKLNGHTLCEPIQLNQTDESEYSDEISAPQDTQSMKRLRAYLKYANVTDSTFVPIPKKENGCVEDGGNQNEKIPEVKSLLWEVVGKQKKVFNEYDNANLYYVMVALNIDDFVDEKKLLEEFISILALEQSSKKLHLSDWKIRLTDRSLTEIITGFSIGTIPPIGIGLREDMEKNKDLKLFCPVSMVIIDESVINAGNEGIDRKISVGSGSFDNDLIISVKNTILLGEQQYMYGAHTRNISTSSVCSTSVPISEISSPILRQSSFDVTSNTSQRKSFTFLNSVPLTTSSTTTKTSTNGITKTVTSTTTTNTKSVVVSTSPTGNMPKTKPLATRIRDAAGKCGKAKVVRQLLEEAGDDFPSLVGVGTTGNFTKNALHLAAWKGDLASISYLTEAGRKFDMDLVNIISLGEGNYGKTPIFYAITQDRDDVVNLLLDLGANLLIVNNKGQTPCSMSVTHLRPETCERMFNHERQQLVAGGKFINYREQYSDGQLYGDLDPRFMLDFDNWTDDIGQDLIKMHQIVHGGNVPITNDSYRAGKGFIMISPLDINAYDKQYSTPLPRSLRPTTPAIRGAKFKKGSIKKKKELEKTIKKERKERREKMRNMLLPEELVVDIDKIEELRISDFIDIQDKDDQNPHNLMVVDTLGTLEYLSKAVQETLNDVHFQEGPESTDSSLFENYMVENAWGLDCEWQPIGPSPVATLQLSSLKHAYIVDVQTLCQPNVKEANTTMTEVENKLSDTLIQIFSNNKVSIVGFGIGQDLAKLSASFPHLPCFRFFTSVIDLNMIVSPLFSQVPPNHMSSLKKCTGVMLRKRINKKQQCSNWDMRPLNSLQIEYALLDAMVLPRLLKRMSSHPLAKARLDNKLFERYPSLRCNYRFTVMESIQKPAIDGEEEFVYKLHMGGVKETLSLPLAKQTWPTSRAHPPQMPEIVSKEVQEEMRRASLKKKISKKEKREAKKNSRSTTPRKSINLIEFVGDINDVPEPGTFLGYTKDSCIHRILGSKFMSSLPDNIRLGYNRRGGVFQLKNSWILFINLAGGVQLGKYRNDFTQGGRQITFTVNPNNPAESTLIDHFFYQNLKNTEKLVFLFVRSGTSSKFMYCGKCGCTGQAPHAEDGIILDLELLDFSKLTSIHDNEYEDIVSFHTNSLKKQDRIRLQE